MMIELWFWNRKVWSSFAGSKSEWWGSGGGGRVSAVCVGGFVKSRKVVVWGSWCMLAGPITSGRGGGGSKGMPLLGGEQGLQSGWDLPYFSWKRCTR